MTASLAVNVPTGSSTLSPKSPTSVFNALGSYADRIRDKEMKDNHVSTSGASSSKKSPLPPPAKDLPNGSGPSTVASSSTSTSTTKPPKAANMAPPPTPKSAPVAKSSGADEKEKVSTKEEVKEEEGAWETVPAGKSRRKERESIASTNWRDRPKEDRPREKKDGSGWRGGDEEKPKGEGRKKGGAGQATTRSTSTHPSSSSTQTATPSAPTARSASVTPATTTRKAWGMVTPSPSSIPIPSSTTPSAPLPRPTPSEAPLSVKVTPVKPTLLPRTTTPPSPSVTGASTAVNTSVTGSVASPTISATAETSSTTTMVTPHGERDDGEEEDWRMRPRKLSGELVGKDIPSLDSPGSKEKPTKAKPVEVEMVKENIQAAPPPSTNAWAERKKALGTPQSTSIAAPQSQLPNAGSSDVIAKKGTTSTSAITSTMAAKLGLPNKPAPLLFGSVEINQSKALPNGEAKSAAAEEGVKIGSMKKKKSAAASTARHVVDTTAFPDLAQAAAKAKKAEGVKQKETEEASVVEEAAGVPRKTKWTAIPATELLAAADEAKRHAQSVASKQKQQAQHTRATPATLPIVPTLAESSSPTQRSARKKTVETRRARTARSGSSSDIRLPPNGSTRRGSSSTAGGGEKVAKPVFGSINGETEASLQRSKSNQGSIVNGMTSEPISRQVTNTSQISSPVRPMTQLSSPKSPNGDLGDKTLPSMTEAAVQLGAESSSTNGTLTNGPNGNTGSNTAPMPQSGFVPNGPPRTNRGGRSSFSGGRGRGGFRGGYKGAGGVGMAHSMSAGMGDGGYRAGSQGGFSTFVPQQQQHGAGANGNAYDQAGQGMYGAYDYGLGMYGTPGGTQARQALPMPPPPMPVTHAVGLDALRFYVLGQVEYYFSMQNLAMDFFLRQQMDSEGWIDIAMITSFNRIKSLTPDPSIVKEVMLLSSLLEVRDDKVRLSYGESKRWILPDAKPSDYVDDGTNASSDDGGESGLGLSVGWGSIPINNGTEAEKKGLGLGMNGRDDLRVEVNKALMKSSPSITSVDVDTKSDVTDTTDIQGVTIENGSDEKDVKIQMGDEEKTASSGSGSSVSEEAEKIELR